MASKPAAAVAKVASFKSKIVPELIPLAQPIETFQPHPDNSRKHDLPSIARSLNQHGQRSAVVVQASTGLIVKGNGTWAAAAQLLNWDQLAFSVQEIDDEHALGYLLADNKASDGSGYDPKKLQSALQKALDGPGLLDTLWTGEELEDLIEADAGLKVLEPGETGAAFADEGYIDQRVARSKAPGEKGKEIPLVLSVADHALFVEWVRALSKRFGTSGTLSTVFEAVRRQANAEDEAVKLGRDTTAESRAAIRREAIVEARNLYTSMPPERRTEATILAIFEGVQPYVPPISPLRAEAVVVPGQTAAFPELDAPPEGEITPISSVITPAQQADLGMWTPGADEDPGELESTAAAQVEALVNNELSPGEQLARQRAAAKR